MIRKDNNVAANYRVDGEIAMVTGASRGLGASIAIELARGGADVAITARSTESLEQAER